MKHSTERILTTHVGSLPRPDDMLEALGAKMKAQPVDQEAFDARLPAAVAEMVRRQADCGLDVVNDGEVGKPSFILYMDERMSGFEQREVAESEVDKISHYLTGSREFLAFPEYYQPELVANTTSRNWWRGVLGRDSDRVNPCARVPLPIKDTNSCNVISVT